jgi:hypothetical protein
VQDYEVERDEHIEAKVENWVPMSSYYCKKNGGSYEVIRLTHNIGIDGLKEKVGEIPYKAHSIWEDEHGNVMAQISVKRNGNGGCCVPEKVMKNILRPRFKFSTMSVDNEKEDLVQITLKL